MRLAVTIYPGYYFTHFPSGYSPVRIECLAFVVDNPESFKPFFPIPPYFFRYSSPQKTVDTAKKSKNVIDKHTKLTIPNKRQILIGICAVLLIYLIWLLLSCNHKKTELPTVDVLNDPVVAEEEQISNNIAENPIVIDEIIASP